MLMLLTEKHQIKPSHLDFKEIDYIAFLSKNLYNATLYVLRNQFFEYKKFKEINKETEAKFTWISYYELERNFKKSKSDRLQSITSQSLSTGDVTSFCNI